MKICCNFKDPDTMDDAVDDAFKALVKPEGIDNDEWEIIKAGRAARAKETITKLWMEYSEYILIEFDLDEWTARVVPRSEQDD